MTESYKTGILADIAYFSEKTDNQIAIITASGTYFGSLLPENMDKEKYAYVLNFLDFHKQSEEFRDGKENFVILVDVTQLTQTGSKNSIPFVILFIDQIIGVFSGQLSSDA